MRIRPAGSWHAVVEGAEHRRRYGSASTIVVLRVVRSRLSDWYDHDLDAGTMTAMQTYRPRVGDAELIDRLAAQGAVLIEGSKACGKTETARQVAASEVLLDVDANAREAALTDPSLVLAGEMPRLIDEWQLEPAVWNHVRRWVDDRRGRFILTGSAVPADDVTRHTGAARISRLRMRPMSLYEAGRSTGQISLKELMGGVSTQAPDPGLQLDDLIDEVCRGGWPGFRDLALAPARRAVRDYLDEVRRVDINRVDGVTRDPERVRRLFQSLARNTATRAPVTTLAADAAGPGSTMTERTAREYLAALTRLMVVEDQPSWTPHLRSRADVRTTSARHFVDPSLAVAALGATPEQLLRDLKMFGLLFESLVVRDLRIYAQAFDGRVKQYRDNKGVEVDAIVETDDGRWAAFEVKLAPGRIQEGADGLRAFAAKIDTIRSGEPAVLGVITGSGYGYVREDGIHIIPIGALRP
jgi:predicted AAA+ superfamily ATPase